MEEMLSHHSSTWGTDPSVCCMCTFSWYPGQRGKTVENLRRMFPFLLLYEVTCKAQIQLPIVLPPVPSWCTLNAVSNTFSKSCIHVDLVPCGSLLDVKGLGSGWLSCQGLSCPLVWPLHVQLRESPQCMPVPLQTLIIPCCSLPGTVLA